MIIEVGSSRSEGGVVLLWMTILLSAIIFLAALAADYGWFAYVRNEAQSAVDAAALAGVAGLQRYNRTGDPAIVYQLASGFNGDIVTPIRNRVASGGPNIAPSDVSFVQYTPADIVTAADNTVANGVRVSRTYQANTFFAAIFGKTTQPLTVSATAISTFPSCFPVDIPIALIDCAGGSNNNCSHSKCGQTILFEARQTPDKSDNSAFYSIPPANPSAVECRNRVRAYAGLATRTSYDSLCVGSNIELNNGQLAGCISDIVAACAALGVCTPAKPWKATVPVLSCASMGETLTGSFPVVGFARVGIIGANATGNPKSITFVKLCGEMVSGPPSGGAGCGFYTPPALVR